ncbi:MAG: hypothetical protein ACJ73D_04960 [Pyrinomonadaceae bacterium]
MSDHGHADNVAAGEQQIAYITSWGAAYNPSNTAITLANLTANHTAAVSSMNGVANARADYVNLINDRENTYLGIRPLVTRVVQYYESTGADQNKIDDVRTLKRKLDGARASSKPTTPPSNGGSTPEPPADSGPGTGSASQQGHTQVIEHLEGIIKLLQEDALYSPNETEIQLPTLTARVNDMKAAKSAVATSLATISNARGHRDDVLYADSTGLYDRAMLTKKYVRAGFGQDSTQYTQLASLKFKKAKVKS